MPTPVPEQRRDIGRVEHGKGIKMLKLYGDVYAANADKPQAPTGVAPVIPPPAPTVAPVYRPQPVEIPGVITQTNQLFQPYKPKE